MPRSVHHREARDDFTMLEEPQLATGAGQDIADQSRRQPIRHPPEGHPLARAAGPQVGRIVAMHREPRPGRLAEGEGGAGMIDVVMGQDHPLEILGVESPLGEEAKDSPEAAGVAGVHDGKSLGALIEIGLSAADARYPLDHSHIIDVLTRRPCAILQGLASAAAYGATVIMPFMWSWILH